MRLPSGLRAYTLRPCRRRVARPPGLPWWPGPAPGAGAPADADARARWPSRKSGCSRLPGDLQGGLPGPGAACLGPGCTRRSARTAPKTDPPVPACRAPAGSRHTPARLGPGRLASASDRPLAWRRRRDSRSVPPSRAVDARRPGHALQDGVGYGAPTPQGAGIGQNRGPNAAGPGEALRLSNTRQVAVGWRGGPDHDAGGTGVRPSRPGRVVAR